MKSSSYNNKDENTQSSIKEIDSLVANWVKALEAKDVAGITADYTPDALLYDAIPPYKTVGQSAIREVWEQCLPYFPETFESEHRDLEIHVDGDLAILHGLHHLNPTSEEDHPCGQMWLRITVCYRRIDGQWKVIHEHVSTPFNPMNNQAWTITDPDTVDTPDYSAANENA